MITHCHKGDGPTDQFCIYSESTGKKLGGPYPTHEAAAKRLSQIEYFKHHDVAEAVQRFDRGTFKRPVRTDAGFLRAEAYLTRAGVFEYRRADGSVVRELRAPEEVFKAASLDSLHVAPLTLHHPPEKVTAQNARRYAVGSVGTDVRADENFVRGTVMITDADAVAAADSGDARELSCGYVCDVEPTPGIHPVHGRYDAVQRNIRYNHVALVGTGRAGHEVRLRLDGGDAEQLAHEPAPASPPPEQRTDSMELTSIRLDDVDYQVTEQAAQAIRSHLSKLDAKVKGLEGDLKAKADEVSTLTAKVDGLEDEKKKLTEKLDAVGKPESVREAVKNRLALERVAGEVLGEAKAKEAKLDELDDAGIRKAVIVHLSPEAKLDGKDDVYLAARFDQAVEQATAAKATEPNTGLATARVHADVGSAQPRTDAAEARRKMIERNRNAWKPKEAAAK